MMLIDDKHRALDFQYILWRFDTEALDKTTLNRLDAGPGGNQDEDEDMNEMDSQGNEVARKNVENIKGSSCCTIFWWTLPACWLIDWGPFACVCSLDKK